MNYESSHPIWKDLVTGKLNCKFELLAAKLLMNRIRVKVSTNNNEETIQECVKEVHKFFVKNEKYAAKDISKIFSKEVL